MLKVWTTASGLQIPYPELTDNHLTNIVNDGYWNENLVEEVKRRKLKDLKIYMPKLKAGDTFVYTKQMNDDKKSGKYGNGNSSDARRLIGKKLTIKKYVGRAYEVKGYFYAFYFECIDKHLKSKFIW